MGLISRFSTFLKAKISQLLDQAEDPNETLDYSYERQLQMLQDVKRGVVEVVTSRRRVEMQAARLRDNAAKLDDQARRALSAGREDLARLALERKQQAMVQLNGLEAQIGDLEKEQTKLTTTEQRLASKVESFRTQKEVIKAQYSAAEAQVKIGESLSGLSEEMADVGLAVERAQEKTERLKARAGAIDELVAEGTLIDVTQSGDSIDRELTQISSSQAVEDELAQMKNQLGMGEAPKQLKEGSE